MVPALCYSYPFLHTGAPTFSAEGH